MALGLIVYDVLYMILAVGLYGSSLVLGARVGLEIAGRGILWPLALFAGALAALLALIAEVALLTALMPRLRPGRYPLMKGAVFYGWIVRSLLRRILFVPGIKFILFSSNILRFLALRALGGKVAFTASVSTDADLLDPSLTTLAPGCTLGARCLVAGHYIQEGMLILGEIKVGPRSLLAAEVLVGPEVTIGGGVVVKSRAALNVGVTIEDRAVIGGDAGLDMHCRIGAGAVLGPRVYVAPKAVVAPGARLDALARAESTTSNAAPAV